MQYVIKDMVGQMIDTLRTDSLFKGVLITRHAGEVNAMMFNNPVYWEGLIKKIPFVLIKYQGRTATKRDSIGSQWFHDLIFSTYVGTKSLKSKEEAAVEAEEVLAKIFDLWHGRMFYSNQNFAANIPRLSGVKIITLEFNQLQPLLESGGQDERLIFTLPEITLYETKHTVKMLAHSIGIDSITMSPKTGSLTYGSGEILQLTATILPSTAPNKNVIWTSSDEDVATVNSDGLVTEAGIDMEDEVIITARSVDGGLTDTCVISIGIPI